MKPFLCLLSLAVLSCSIARAENEIVRAGAIDTSSFPRIRLEISCHDPVGRPLPALAPREFVARWRREARPGPLAFGDRFERATAIGRDDFDPRYALELVDGDLDPSHLRRSVIVSYRREAPPYYGASLRIDYTIPAETIRRTLLDRLEEPIEEIEQASDPSQFEKFRPMLEALRKALPAEERIRAAGDRFDRVEIAWLIEHDRGATALARATQRVRRDPPDPIDDLVPLFLGHFRGLLARGRHTLAIEFVERLREIAPEGAAYSRLEAQARLRRALALYAGHAESFDAFAAELGRAIVISPDDPTLAATLLEEGIELAGETLATSNLETALAILESMRAPLGPAGPPHLEALDEARAALAASVLPPEALGAYAPADRSDSIARALLAQPIVRVLTSTVGHLPPEARAALWRDLPDLDGISAVRLVGEDGALRLSSRPGETGSRPPGLATLFEQRTVDPCGRLVPEGFETYHRVGDALRLGLLFPTEAAAHDPVLNLERLLVALLPHATPDPAAFTARIGEALAPGLRYLALDSPPDRWVYPKTLDPSFLAPPGDPSPPLPSPDAGPIEEKVLRSGTLLLRLGRPSEK